MIPFVTKVYKPELDCCPFCHGKLKYRYTVSNKVIHFSNGKVYRIKNLGYSCSNPECHYPNLIYTSQTAAKLCVKGYTYSTKVLALILYYKSKHKSREDICNKFSLEGIEISDRNIDIIYDKLSPKLTMDYKKNIEIEYGYMLKEYGQIMVSIDSISLPDMHRLLIIRNFFTSTLIGVHLFKCESDSDFDILDDYLNKDLNITRILTVRPIGRTYKQIEKRIDLNKTKIVSYLKY